LNIRQPDTGSTGVRPYFGSITVTVQELDGTFLQKLNIEENKTSPFVITCHSKSRRNKKKKIPLCTGEEVDMDLSMMDSHDSPVLWIRIDPDMQILRQIIFTQPDYNWQYQLKYERDITAQLDSLQVLMEYPTVATRKTMMEMIEDERCYYRVRCKAALNLTKIANDMAITTTSGGWQAPTSMINIFKRLFGSHSCPHIIRLNNFSTTNLQSYFLQKTIPKALAGLRVPPHRICPPEVLKFLLDLFKYNDNSKNSFSDNYYRASLIEALAETVTPVVVPLFNNSMQSTTHDQIPSETKLVAEEITRCLNMDSVLPCYKYVVTVACLKAIQQLQRMGHLPSHPALFRSYTSENLFFDVRCAAVVQLVEIIRAEQSHSDLDFLIDLIENDKVPAFKFFILSQLYKNPPMSLHNYPNCNQVKDRLWTMMNSTFAHDSKLRCAAADVFFRFFGKSSLSSTFAGDLNHKSKKKKKKKDKDKDRERKKARPKEGLNLFLGQVPH
jgi:transcription initiation factor TFIID subunit 2